LNSRGSGTVLDAADRTLISELKSSSDASPIGLIARDAESLQMGHLADLAGWLNVRFAPILLKKSKIEPHRKSRES
jgi:hypothetical protein